MSGDRAPVAAVVVTWNSSRHLEGCLGSLRLLARPPAEVVVVDNGSTDGTQDRIRGDFPEVALIECGANVGYCRANNLGIARTRSPFVLVLNPDTRLEPRFLEELLRAFDDATVGMAGGKLLRFDGKTLDSAGQELGRSRQPIDRGYGEPDRGRYESDAEVFGVCGAAALYRRSMLESVADPGGEFFNETFFAFFEDLDLAWRARRKGWKAVYRHRAVGLHARGGTAADPSGLGRVAAMMRRSPDTRYHVVKNRYLTILRNDTRRSYLRDLPFIALRDVATAALLLFTSPGVLGRLWRGRAVFRDALRRRGLDSAGHGHHVPSGRKAPDPPGGSARSGEKTGMDARREGE